MLCSEIHILAATSLGKNLEPIFKRLSGHQNPSGGFGEDNNLSPQPAVEHRPEQPGA